MFHRRGTYLPPGEQACIARLNPMVCNHCLNSSTVRELLCELQYLHAGTLFARPRPPCDRGRTWSVVNTNRFLTSVSASPGQYSCAPQYQHKPPVFIQTYCRLIFAEFNVRSILRGYRVVFSITVVILPSLIRHIDTAPATVHRQPVPIDAFFDLRCAKEEISIILLPIAVQSYPNGNGR